MNPKYDASIKQSQVLDEEVDMEPDNQITKMDNQTLYPAQFFLLVPESERSERRGLCIFGEGVSGYYGG